MSQQPQQALQMAPTSPPQPGSSRPSGKSRLSDNFFIEDPHKLRNNFFNKDKSMQIVELLAQKHHHESPSPKKPQQFHPFRISFLMKKPDYKLSSEEHIIQLLKQVQHTLDYREQKSTDWLSLILDDHFVELVKMDEVVDIIDQISAYVESQCALLREIETTKCLLKPVAELLENNLNQTSKDRPLQKPSNSRNQRIFHRVDYIEL